MTRLRRHGNFVENVALILLLILIAELLGTPGVWLHAAGALWVTGRILHAVGIRHDNAKTIPRILGGVTTTLSSLIATEGIVVRAIAN